MLCGSAGPLTVGPIRSGVSSQKKAAADSALICWERGTTRDRFGELTTRTSESESVVRCSLPNGWLKFFGNILMTQHRVRLPAKLNASRIRFEAFFKKKKTKKKTFVLGENVNGSFFGGREVIIC